MAQAVSPTSAGVLSLSQWEIAQQIFERIWRGADYNFAGQVFTEDCLHHFYEQIDAEPISGPSGYIWIIQSFHRAFSDYRVSYEADEEGEGVCWSLSGLHRRAFLGVPALRKPTTVAGNDLFRFDQGRIQETWASWNVTGFMERISPRSPN